MVFGIEIDTQGLLLLVQVAHLVEEFKVRFVTCRCCDEICKTL